MNNLQNIMKYMLVVFLLMISVSYASAFDQSTVTIQDNLLLRKIGHQFLRATGDGTSRILPIEDISGGGYRLPFENQFAFLPDSLAEVVKRLNGDGMLPVHFTFTVTEIRTGKIVYGFTSEDMKKGDIPCIGRALPKANYALQMYIFRKKEAIGGNNNLVILYTGIFLIVVVAVGTVFYIRQSKKEFNNEHAQAGGDQPLAGTLSIGKYTFDPGRRLLTFDQEQTALTAKELTLLNILIKKINQVMDRNTLLKEGWEDEGVITGRSLDMYVSKLRKKLQKDPLVKITNFHGRGYSLQINSD